MILYLKYSIPRISSSLLLLPLLLILIITTSCTLPTLSARIEDSSESTPLDGSPIDSSSGGGGGGLIWQPLRATFRPLNRRQQQPPPLSPSTGSRSSSPSLADPLALASSIENFDAFSAGRSGPFGLTAPTPAPFPLTSPEVATFSGDTTTPVATTLPTTPAPASLRAVASGDLGINNNDNDEDQPTRVPLNRFRPTKPPSVDPQSQPSNSNSNTNHHHLFTASGSHLPTATATSNQTNYRITSECFECICEASTNCNPNSRCQTSDVRHTRCGLFLISYDQWLETGLSRQLVSREALARDAAADERAFYECVTDRDCSERLMGIYMQRMVRDCDKDGRVDCYDVAAIHQGGLDQCNGESLLDSQYWSDFNACFGFGR